MSSAVPCHAMLLYCTAYSTYSILYSDESIHRRVGIASANSLCWVDLPLLFVAHHQAITNEELDQKQQNIVMVIPKNRNCWEALLSAQAARVANESGLQYFGFNITIMPLPSKSEQIAMYDIHERIASQRKLITDSCVIFTPENFRTPFLIPSTVWLGKGIQNTASELISFGAEASSAWMKISVIPKLSQSKISTLCSPALRSFVVVLSISELKTNTCNRTVRVSKCAEYIRQYRCLITCEKY